MTGSALLVSMPIVVGISIVIQAVFMAQMDRRMGTLESVFITYGVGFLIIGLVLLSRRGGNLIDGVGLHGTCSPRAFWPADYRRHLFFCVASRTCFHFRDRRGDAVRV